MRKIFFFKKLFFLGPKKFQRDKRRKKKLIDKIGGNRPFFIEKFGPDSIEL